MIKFNVTKVEKKEKGKNTWAFVTARDCEGKYPEQQKHVMGDGGDLLLKEGAGIYDVNLEKNEKGYWNWETVVKIGNAGAAGTNGSGVASTRTAEVVSDPRLALAVASIEAAGHIVGGMEVGLSAVPRILQELRNDALRFVNGESGADPAQQRAAVEHVVDPEQVPF